MSINPNLIIGVFLLASVGLAVILALRNFHISKRQSAQHGDCQRALDVLDKMIQSDPSNALAIWQKGEIYEAMGNAEMAIRSFRTAHTLCPKAYSTGDYRDAFVRVTKSRPDLGLRPLIQHPGPR